MHTSQDQSRRMEIHRLMSEAAAVYGRGDHVLAAQLCARVLALEPAMPEALHLAGVCALAAGDPRQARVLLEQAAALKPGDAQLAHNLGIARTEAGDLGGARAAFAHAAALDPQNPSAQFNLGVISEKQGDAEQAEAAYRRCFLLAPHDAVAAASLAALREQKGAIEEAARWCETALRLDPKEPVARITRAQLHFRAGEYDPAAVILEGLQPEALSLRNRALATGKLGMVYDRMDRPAEAWRMFLAAKETLRAGVPGVDTGVYSFAVAERIDRNLEALLAAAPPAEGEAPVFLLGFPRSGTTLLDQILAGHPGIAVLEEKDTLLAWAQRHLLDDASLRAFMETSPQALAEDQRRYWRRVEDYLPGRPQGQLLVDKMPLNTLFLPVLVRLFPAARFIFALRDPRDVVLSCFMQTFALNEAMRHFLTLQEAADFYAAVMDIGRRSLTALPERIHQVRYEDLVEDPEREARRLLEFLGMQWDPGVLDVQTTAKRRRINTPSYHQVARPIYGDARGRWRRYERQLEPVMEKLEPFVKAFGYK